MGIKTELICRGQGTAYFSFRVNGVNEQDLQVIATLNDIVIPCIKRIIVDFEKPLNCIVAVPLFDKGKLRLVFKGQGGQLISSKSFTWNEIKWLSRFNYRKNWTASKALRDFDCRMVKSKVSLVETSFTKNIDAKQFVLKAKISVPESCVSLQIDLLNEKGEEVCPLSFYESNFSLDSVETKTKSKSVTVRIPDDDKTYCLVARGDGLEPGFICLDTGSKISFLAGSSIFYKDSYEENWVNKSLCRDGKNEALLPVRESLDSGPKFSIVVPLYNTPSRLLKIMIDSVKRQLYPNWELVLVNSTPNNEELKHALEGSADDERICIVLKEGNEGISKNTNTGISVASGDYIAFLDHDDKLDRKALLRYAERLKGDSGIDVLYSDEDIIENDGSYKCPHFKSDFNIDLLRSHNYITHFLCVRACLAKELLLNSTFDGAQDYDFVLRLSERTKKFVHVPEVLYHWRMSENSTAKSADNKAYAEDAGLNALKSHLDRLGFCCSVERQNRNFFYKTEYEVSGSPKVSILIPNKDNVYLLRRCIESIFKATEYENFEIIIIENNSTEQQTFDYYGALKEKFSNIKIIEWTEDFNYSAINNYGARHADGDYILLLNNDTEATNRSWLSSMLGYCQRQEVAVVGAKLMYPDDTVQHVGVAMKKSVHPDITGGPVHMFTNVDKTDPCYFNRAVVSQDVLAVTGACMLIKKSVYDQLGGLSEKYKVAYNDIDFCLRCIDAGYLVVIDPYAELYHYESQTRGYEDSEDKKMRFYREQGLFRADWTKYYVNGDPYYSSHCL